VAGDKNIYRMPPVVARRSCAHLGVAPLGLNRIVQNAFLEPHRGLTSSHQDGPTKGPAPAPAPAPACGYFCKSKEYSRSLTRLKSKPRWALRPPPKVAVVWASLHRMPR
jgi:hypothetical protein